VTFDVTNIQSDEGSYVSKTSAFGVAVGEVTAAVDQTATQATSPLSATNASATSDLTAAFTPVGGGHGDGDVYAGVHGLDRRRW